MLQRRTDAASWRSVSFWFRPAIRIGRGARRNGRASHVAADGNATTVCLDAGRRWLWRFGLWGFHRREEIDKGRPKPCRRNDEPASEPPQDLLIALVTQEPPELVHDSCPACECAQSSTEQCAQHPITVSPSLSRGGSFYFQRNTCERNNGRPLVAETRSPNPINAAVHCSARTGARWFRGSTASRSLGLPQRGSGAACPPRLDCIAQTGS